MSDAKQTTNTAANPVIKRTYEGIAEKLDVGRPGNVLKELLEFGPKPTMEIDKKYLAEDNG